jgi:hypothetical protein
MELLDTLITVGAADPGGLPRFALLDRSRSVPHVLCTALNGALERRPEGWFWRSGKPEPRVRDAEPVRHFGLALTRSGLDIGWVYVPPTIAANEAALHWVWEAWNLGLYGIGDSPPDGKPAIRVPLADWNARWDSSVVGPEWDTHDDAPIRQRAEREARA